MNLISLIKVIGAKTEKNYFRAVENQRLMSLISYCIIAIVIFLIYFNALYQAPRGDELIFVLLYRISHISSLWQALSHGYNINRTIPTSNIDALLFRPIYYIVINLKIFIFGYHFIIWNLFSIVLHIFIVILLYYYFNLLNAKTKIFNFLIALLFGLLYASTEMVMWTAVSGNLLFCLFSILTLIFLEHFLNSQKKRYIPLILILALLAAFSYDTGNLFVIIVSMALIGIVLSQKCCTNEKRILLIALSLLCIPIIYFILGFVIHYNFVLSVINHIHHQASQQIHVKTIISDYLKVISFWISSPFLPLYAYLYPGPRITVILNQPAVKPPYMTLFVFQLFFIISITVLTIKNKFRNIRWDIIFISLSTIFAYIFVIIMGRTLFLGLDNTLYSNIYYIYTFFLFFSIFIVALLSPLLNLNIKGKLYFHTLIYMGLLFLIIFNAYKLSTITHIQRYQYSGQRLALIQNILKLKESQKDIKNFSFSVEEGCKYNDHWDDIVISWPFPGKIPQHLHKHYTLATILFPYSYKEKNPLYIVKCPQ